MFMRRYRRRHVLFRLYQSGPPVSEKQLVSAVRRSLLSIYGEVCVADSHFYLDFFDEATGIGIFQCNANTLLEVLTAACVLGMINNTRVSFAPRRTSGTVKSLSKYLRALLSS